MYRPDGMLSARCRRWSGLRALLIGWFALLMIAPVNGEDEFLEPQQAFRFSASLRSNASFEVRFVIAEGYYMYRDRFRFSVEPTSVALGSPVFPPGQWHEDEFFGRSEVYRREVMITIPIEAVDVANEALRLVVVSQGCADAGICYLPTTESMQFQLIGGLGAPGLSP
jgi:thiol:disulfide interchange protein DsbD